MIKKTTQTQYIVTYGQKEQKNRKTQNFPYKNKNSINEVLKFVNEKNKLMHVDVFLKVIETKTSKTSVKKVTETVKTKTKITNRLKKEYGSSKDLG